MTSREDIDAFGAHPLWNQLTSMRLEFKESTPRSTTDKQTIARVLATLGYVAEFRNMPPELFPSNRSAVADNLFQVVVNLASQWQGWDQSAAMNPTTVQQMDHLCDQILAQLRDSAWPALQKESRAAAIRMAAETYLNATEASVAGVMSDVSDQETRLGEAQETLNQILLSATAKQTQIDQAIESVEATRLAQAENAAEQLQAELGKMHTAARNQREQMQEAFDTAAAEWNAQAATSLTQLRTDAETGEKLVQYVGDQATAGGYLKFADKERRSYRIWIGTGIVAVAAAAGYLYVQFRDYADDTDPSVALIIFKAALSLTALAFSGFCFREAGKRQRQSLEARYRALDLLALRPYTNDLDEEDKRVFRELLGQRLFGNSPEQRSGKTDEKVTTLRLDLGDVKSALDTAKVAKDLAGG